MSPLRRCTGRLLVAIGLLFLAGCVSQDDYDEVLRQNQALRRSLLAVEERLATLQKSIEEQEQKKPEQQD
jgi:outer membrane murein-binding lipoprotein Lpp